MSKQFKDFSRKWGFHHAISSPLNPQSNGKAEATVISMKKKSSKQHGHMAALMNQHSLTHCSIATHLHYEINVHQPRSFLGTPSKTPSHHITMCSHHSGRQVQRRPRIMRLPLLSRWSATTRELPDIRVGSNMAIQNSVTKLWDIYGVVTAVGPHRQYFIKIASGCILVRNCQSL